MNYEVQAWLTLLLFTGTFPKDHQFLFFSRDFPSQQNGRNLPTLNVVCQVSHRVTIVTVTVQATTPNNYNKT